MKIRLIIACYLLVKPLLIWAQEIPNGEDAFARVNVVNIPNGRILLAKRNLEYCAVVFLSSKWDKDEASATYKSLYIPAGQSFLRQNIRSRQDNVYEKQPRRIFGRLATNRSRDAIFCGEITLKWSGAPNRSAWVYLDEERTLKLAPTGWRDSRDVDLGDRDLKWFGYGDVSPQSGLIKIPLR